MICGLSEECGCPAQKRIRDAPGKVAHLENGHCLSTIEFRAQRYENCGTFRIECLTFLTDI